MNLASLGCMMVMKIMRLLFPYQYKVPIESSYIVFGIPVIAAQTSKFCTYSIVSECKGSYDIVYFW